MRGTPTSLRGCPAWWRHRKRQQFSDRPAMVGDPSRHGRCPVGCYCASRMGSKAETRVIGAKVIDCTDQIHPVLQRQGAGCQGPTAARQWSQTLTKRGVEALDVGGVNHPGALRAALQHLDACRCAIHDTALGLDDTPPLVALDDLGNQDVAPGTQPGPSTLLSGVGCKF